MKTTHAIAAIWIVCASVVAGDDVTLQPVADPSPVLQELQRKMPSFRSVCLEFTQERHLKLFAEPLKCEGVLLVQQPDLIRWETTAPYQSIMLGNGKSVAQFENVSGEWKKLKLGFPQLLRQVLGQMGMMHQGHFDALKRDFTISVATASNVAALILVPKDQTVHSMISSLELRMPPDFSTTREVVMNEPGGDFTRIIFSRERRDVVFPAGTFDQAKPLDVAAVRTACKDGP